METGGKELKARKERRELERGSWRREGSGGGNLEKGYGMKELELGIGYDGQNGRSWMEARDAGAVGREGP